MKKLLMIVAASLYFIQPAFADHNGKQHPPLRTISVSVDGLVCDFCARTLEKVFYQRDGVESVGVNLDTHILKLDVTEGTTLTDEEIKKMVTDSGYNVTNITR